MTTDERIYAEAAKYLGTREVPGQGSSALIRKWIKQAASWLDGDDSKTAWCGCFRGAIGFDTATGAPKDHFRAAEWAKWGVHVPLDPKLWKKGMTVVMSRVGGNHVAIVDRVVGDTLYHLGGNQSDAVTISKTHVSKISAVRRAV